MSFSYTFPAVKGIQAKREYYITMVPIAYLTKLFNSDIEYVSPEYRAQRTINEQRIPEIRDYIINNKESYVFSALSASIDGEFHFKPSEIDSNIGLLEIDMNAKFLINDGQHRKAAIEAAVEYYNDLVDETISVVFFKDEGLARSQQMFADLNKHAVKSTMSLSTLYDNRDDLANAIKKVIQSIPFLNKYVDKEKDNLGKNSLKLFTLANFLRANKRIIRECEFKNSDIEFLIKYWSFIFKYIKEWEELENKDIPKRALREEYILTLAVTLNAFGRLGRYFYENQDKINLLFGLGEIDWLRANDAWINRAINQNGKIINNDEAIIKICNYIKLQLGICLSKEEMVKENEYK